MTDNGRWFIQRNEIFISHILVGKPIKIEQNKNALDIYLDEKLIKFITYVN